MIPFLTSPTINFVILLIINLLGIWLAFLVYFTNPKNKNNRLFAWWIIPTLLFINLGYFSNLPLFYPYALPLTRLRFGSVAVFFMIGYFFFCVYFPQKTTKVTMLDKIHTFGWIIILLLSVFTTFMIKDIKITSWGTDVIFGNGKLIYYLVTSFSVFLFLFSLFKKFYTLSQEYKPQLQYFLVGNVIYALSNLIFNIFFPIKYESMRYYQFGDYSVIFFFGFIAYAILKKNLFNIKIILTTLFISLIAILLGIETFIFTESIQLIILKSITLFGFLWFGYLLIRNIKREIERRAVLERLTKQLGDKAQDLSALLDVSKIIATKETDTKTMVQNALDSIPQKLKHLNFLTGWLNLYDADKHDLYAYAINQNFLGKKVITLLSKLGTPFETYRVSLSQNTLVVKSFLKQEIFIGEKLSSFISPPVKETIADTLQKLIGAQSCIVVPVTAHGKKIGILGLGIKLKVSEIDDRVKNLVSAFTNHLAITLENSRYMENLQAKTQDLQSLLDIAKVATLSLKTKEITQEILNSIPRKLKHLEYIGGMLTMRDDKSNRLRTYAITQTSIIQKALNILNKPFEKQSIQINGHSSLLLKTLGDGQIHLSDKIEDFITPPVPKRIARGTQRIIGMKTGVGVPIIIRGKTEGVIMFAIKRKTNEIGQRDKEIMTAFANHLGLTIENSRLFEKTVEQKRQLQKANKNLIELGEAKSNFLSVASHQLRTPVSIVKGMLSMLVEGTVPKEKEHQFIERSFVNVERLSSIIHDLLSASAVEGVDFRLNRQLAQINDIIVKVVEEKTVQAKAKNLNLVYNQPKIQIRPLNIDANKIREAVANLVDNAIQYTSVGGIEINVKVEGGYFIFSIKDTGIGIDAKDFPKLFQKISRLPNAINIRPNGTGLGLFLVKHIIKAHNGKVDVKSDGVNGKGSEFRFWLGM